MSADLPLSTTQRSTLHRLRERGRADRADLHAVLDAGLICHLGVIVDGSPVGLPTGYGRAGNTLYLHGSSAGREHPRPHRRSRRSCPGRVTFCLRMDSVTVTLT
jgi:hypothetical protein